jgi:cytochrome P450
MTDGQLRDEVVTMLLAGHETTATEETMRLHPPAYIISRRVAVNRRVAG